MAFDLEHYHVQQQDAFLEPEFAQLSLAMCEQGELTYLAQSTHWLHQEEPAAVNKLLLEFLAERP